jgi:hypothetical protein
VVNAANVIPGGSLIADYWLPAATPIGPQSNMKGRFDRGAQASDRRLNKARSDREMARIFGNTQGMFAAFEDITGKPTPGIGAPRPRPVSAGGSRKKPRGRSGPSADTIARRAEAERVREERRQQGVANELSDLDRDILDARRALSVAEDMLATLKLQEIESERASYNANLASQVTQKKLTAAEAEQLRLKNDQLAALRTDAVNAAEAERKREAAQNIAAADLQNQRDLKQAGAGLLETREAQRVSDLAILDLSMELERLELEGVIASRESTEAQKEIARRRLAILGQLKGSASAEIDRDHEGPMDSYRRRLRETTGDLNTAFEEIQVRGLENAADAVAELGSEYLKLGGIAGSVVDGIIRDLLRLAAQQAAIALLGGGGSGESGGGGFFGKLLSSIGIISSAASAAPGGGIGGGKNVGGKTLKVKGKAAGGPVSAGTPYLVGERGPETFVPGSSGMIVPQGKAISPIDNLARSASAPSTIRVAVEASPYFDTRVVQVTGPRIQIAEERAAARGTIGGAALVSRRSGRRQRNTL